MWNRICFNINSNFNTIEITQEDKGGRVVHIIKKVPPRYKQFILTMSSSKGE